MFTVSSRRAATVLTLDSTRQQANARARFLAKHYGVSFSVTEYVAYAEEDESPYDDSAYENITFDEF